MSVIKKFSLAIIALAGLLALAAGTAGAAPYTNQPTVRASTTNPAVGGTLTLSGSGFGANDTLTITLDTGDTLGTTTTDSSGAYSVTVTLPAGVSGDHTIVVADEATDESASIAITIGSGSNPSGGGGVSNTGVAVMSIGGVGALLLVGGLSLMLLGKRRRVSA
ncbi:MAG: IPT/TIG domain-containing protein [Streptomyces sp.]|uniref:IPT/TIG domain-containing protein n=1 Tax=Streptomyces sp. TaxID=1931 RepID=UPI0025E822A4|nr:IPT/TIG domain-containing protein [Streptomyces sp.]MBW8801510.1 IPT/TIG domain-containing protein [Streptomyces sp.]